jgi:hypothetical protein
MPHKPDPEEAHLCKLFGRIEHRFNVWTESYNTVEHGQKCFCGQMTYQQRYRYRPYVPTSCAIIGLSDKTFRDNF